MLTDTERQNLLTEVATFILQSPAGLQTLLPTQHIISIRTNPIPVEYAFSIINYCERSAWVEDPALIVQLLKKFSYYPTFKMAIDRILQGRPLRFHIPSRVWDTMLLALDLPFINREMTRVAIERFDNPLIATTRAAGVRVLVVKGPQESGKSYTYDYLRYVCSFLGSTNVRLVWIDLKKQASPLIGPADLTTALLDQINPRWRSEGVQLPDQTQQSSRWVNQLSTTIATQISATGVMTIIVIDGLDSKDETSPPGTPAETNPRISKETIDLINYLADVATGRHAAESSNDLLRLVLIGYNSPLVDFNSRIRVDDIKPLTRADVEKYFRDYAALFGIDTDAAGMTALLDLTFKDDVPTDPGRTKKLAQRAFYYVRQAFGEPPPPSTDV